jgi:succinate dehydrogenase cytochrome b556 subunit
VARNAIDWYLQRITGGLLLFLLAAHFWVEHFMSAPVRRGDLTYAVIASRLSNPVWRVIDVSFLLVALYHGLSGLRGIILDYGPFSGRTLALTNVVLIAVGIAWAWWGIAAFSRL